MKQSRTRAPATAWIVMIPLTLGIACTDLPVASEGRTPVTLELGVPGAFLLEDTAVVTVSVFDLEGRRVVGAPVRWTVGEDPAREADFVVGRSPDTLILADFPPGIVRIRAVVEPEDPFLESDSVVADVRAGYGPIQFGFAEVGRDTLLTDRADLVLRLLNRKLDGAPLRFEIFVVEREPHRIIRGLQINQGVPHEPGVIHLRWNTVGPGIDTLVVSNPACLDPCADTLVITLDPRPTALQIRPSGPLELHSLGGSIDLWAVTLDAVGEVVDVADPLWSLANPEDSVVVAIVDPVTGTIEARSNGSATVRATLGDLSSEATVTVRQAPAQVLATYVPDLLVGLGVRDSVVFTVRDERGNDVLDNGSGYRWEIEPNSVAFLEEFSLRRAFFVSRDFGPAETVFSFEACRTHEGCVPDQRRDAFRVIPEPDSIQIVNGVGVPVDSVTAPALGAFDAFGVNVFLPGEVLLNRRAQFESLDEAVVAVSGGRLLVAVQPGTGRVVASLGASTDTLIVVVDPN
ncbi:MAG: hypothetical protein RQ751_07650 [Longimicrobiales bacterium]|nr:hypothetical protein [Longimicrobiales bacterium]